MRLREISRRRFLAAAATSGLVAGATVPTAGAQAPGQITVWRLRSDWAEPRGPRGKMRLESMASRNSARYRWALTEQAALDMNLHVGSWAPAYPVVVNGPEFMAIWNHPAGAYMWRNPWKNVDVNIFDERFLPRIPGGTGLFARALAPAPPPRFSAFAGGAVESASTSASGPVAGASPPAASAVAAPPGAAHTPIAITGTEAAPITTLGFGLIATGAGLARLARRRRAVATTERD